MKRIKILTVLLLVLTGCSGQENTVRFEGSLLRPDHEFRQTACDVREGCYEVENEMEAAVLMVNLIDEGIRETAIVSRKDLDMNKAFAYALSAAPASFDLEYSIRPLMDQKARLKIRMQIQDEQAYLRNRETAGKIVDQIRKIPDCDPVRELHDWIVMNTCYDQQATELDDQQRSLSPSYHASGVLELGKATCSGYTEAYHLLLREAGIGSLKVSGNRMNHAWNLVDDGGQMKYIDTTFDDPVPDVENAVRYDFYGMDEQTLQQNYIFDESTPLTLNRKETEAFFSYCYGK